MTVFLGLPILLLALGRHDIGNGNRLPFDRMGFHQFNESVQGDNSRMLGRVFRGDRIPIVCQLDDQGGSIFTQLGQDGVLQGHALTASHREASGDAVESWKHELGGLLSVNRGDRSALPGNHPFDSFQHPGFLSLIECRAIGIVRSGGKFFEGHAFGRKHQSGFQCGVDFSLQGGGEHGFIEYALRISETRLSAHSQPAFCTGYVASGTTTAHPNAGNLGGLVNGGFPKGLS